MNLSHEKIVVACVIVLAALLGVFLGTQTTPSINTPIGFSKFQYLTYLENESDTTDFMRPYAVYELCNPEASQKTLSDEKDFNVSIVEGKGKGRVVSTSVFQAVVTQRQVSVNRPYYLQNHSEINASGANVTTFVEVDNYTNWIVNDVEWIPFVVSGKKIKKDECVKIKVQIERNAKLGESAIDNVIGFGGFTFPEYSWFNTSALHKQQIKINVTTTKNITDFVLPIVISPANCTGVQYTDMAETNLIRNENGSNDTTCTGVDYINITAYRKETASFDPNFTVYRYYGFVPGNKNRTNAIGSNAQVWNDSYVSVWNMDEANGLVVDSLANTTGTATATRVYNSTPNTTIGRSRGFGNPSTGGFGSSTNSYIDVSGNGAFGNDISIIARIRTYGEGANVQSIYTRKAASPSANEHAFLVLSTGPIYGLHTGCSPDVVGSTDIRDGKWHWVILTRNSTHQWLYLDGAVENALGGGRQACTIPTPRLAASLSAYIGYNQLDSIRQFNGTIDTFWLLNRTVYDDEALALMNTSQSIQYGPEETYSQLILNLSSPVNNTPTENSTQNFTFSYNFSGNTTNINNCSLYLNETGPLRFNQSNSTQVVPGKNNFTLNTSQQVSVVQYVWNVNCTELAGNSIFSDLNYTAVLKYNPAFNRNNFLENRSIAIITLENRSYSPFVFNLTRLSVPSLNCSDDLRMSNETGTEITAFAIVSNGTVGLPPKQRWCEIAWVGNTTGNDTTFFYVYDNNTFPYTPSNYSPLYFVETFDNFQVGQAINGSGGWLNESIFTDAMFTSNDTYRATTGNGSAALLNLSSVFFKTIQKNLTRNVSAVSPGVDSIFFKYWIFTYTAPSGSSNFSITVHDSVDLGMKAGRDQGSGRWRTCGTSINCYNPAGGLADTVRTWYQMTYHLNYTGSSPGKWNFWVQNSTHVAQEFNATGAQGTSLIQNLSRFHLGIGGTSAFLIDDIWGWGTNFTLYPSAPSYIGPFPQFNIALGSNVSHQINRFQFSCNQVAGADYNRLVEPKNQSFSLPLFNLSYVSNEYLNIRVSLNQSIAPFKFYMNSSGGSDNATLKEINTTPRTIIGNFGNIGGTDSIYGWVNCSSFQGNRTFKILVERGR